MRDCPLGNPPRSYDCHLRWHDDQIGKPASYHPKFDSGTIAPRSSVYRNLNTGVAVMKSAQDGA
jgi:hypothetical protein